MSYFFRPKKKEPGRHSASRVTSPLRTCASNDAWDMYSNDNDKVESPEDLRPSTIASSIITKPDDVTNNTLKEEEWNVSEYGECESCDEDYVSEDDEDEDDEDSEMSSLSEQDRQRAMGMTIAQLRAILPQEEGTVWRISGQRLVKITASSSPPIGVFECGEVYLCALPTHSFLQLHLWIGRRAHRDKIGLGCVRAIQMRAALALLSMTGGKEVTIQQRQGHESHAFLLPFGGSIRVVARAYPRRRLLRALPLDLNPEIIVYRVMAKDFSQESLPTVQIRRLRPYPACEKNEEASSVEPEMAQEEEVIDRSSTRRGSVQAAIQSRVVHQQETEDYTEVLARQESEMHERGWKWLETLLKVNRDTNTCLLILTLRPSRLHQVLHGHKQFSVEALGERVVKCEKELADANSKLEQLNMEATELASSLSTLQERSLSLETSLMNLRAAVESIKALDRQDISQVKAMKKPPKSMMLVLEAVTKVLQSSEEKKEKRASMPSYFEMAKKTWLAGLKMEPCVFEDFEGREGLNHAAVLNIIEPLLQQKSFQAQDAAKTSKVAGALCMWIKELSLYCRVYLDTLDLEESTDDIEDKQATVEEEKDILCSKLPALVAKFSRLNKRHELAIHLRDSLATQRHTLTIWMGSKKEGSGLGGEIEPIKKAEEKEVKDRGGPFQLSRVASLLIKLGPSVTYDSNNRSRQRAAVFAAACGSSGSFSLQGTVAAHGSTGGHHRLHTDDQDSSDEDDEDDDEDEDLNDLVDLHKPGMSIVDGGFLAMEISTKEGEDEEEVELVCERAEESLSGSVEQLNSESAYIFISPSHNQYNFEAGGKSAVTDVDVFLWMGSKTSLAARLGARRSVRVLTEWAVDSLGVEVDRELGIEDNIGDDGDDDVDDYGSVASEVLSPSNLSLTDENSLNTFPGEVPPSRPDALDGVSDLEINEPSPRMLSMKSGSARTLKKKASVRWKESVVDNPQHGGAKMTKTGSERSMALSNKVIQAHKLEHSASIANLLTFIESNVKEELSPLIKTGKSFNSGVAPVLEEEDDDSDYDEASSMRQSSISRLSVGEVDGWDETVSVCGSKATLRLHLHTVSQGKEPFDFKCYFTKHTSGNIFGLEDLRQRKTTSFGAANSPFGLSLTLHQRKALIFKERRSLWEKRGSMVIIDDVPAPKSMHFHYDEGKVSKEFFEELKKDAMNEARRVCLDADIRYNDSDEEEDDEEEDDEEEDGHEHVIEFDETAHEIEHGPQEKVERSVEKSTDEDDEEEDDEEDIVGCCKGLVADALLGEEGSDEGLEGLKGDDGGGELLAWRLDADGLLSSVPPEDVGMLESHYVYVFFYASTVKESSGEDMRFVTYIWHGARAPRHQGLEWEMNVRPNFVVEFWEHLTAPLRPKPLFIDIRQGKEPAHFRRIFEAGDRPPFVVYSSSLTICAETPYFRLITFRVRELDCGFVSISQVPSIVNSFLSSDVLIVIKDIGKDEEDDETVGVNELWFWVGADSDDEARRCAALSVSVMLEYMGLPESLCHEAQVVSEEEVLKEVVSKSMSVREDTEGLSEDKEEEASLSAHARFSRLLKAMTQGGATSSTEGWWEKRKKDHLSQVVQGEGDEWEHVSKDRLWSESCPTARLYKVSNSSKKRQEMPSSQILDREKGRTQAEKLKSYFIQLNPVSKKQTNKVDHHYRLKRVPFFLFSDLMHADHGCFVDSPVGVFAYEPIGLSFEASWFLHQIVAERAKERSLLASETLGSTAVLSSEAGTPRCPVYWLNKDDEALNKFKSYFQEYSDMEKTEIVKSKSSFLFGHIKDEDDVSEWHQEVSAYDRRCLRRGSVTMAELSDKRPRRVRQDINTVFTSQEATTVLPHHHRVRRESVLTTDTLEFLTAHPTAHPTALPSSLPSVPGSAVKSRRASMVPAARRFSVQQLLVEPSSPIPGAAKGRKSRRLSLQPLASSPDLKLLNTKVAESSYKKERRASLTPTATPQPTSAMIRSFGFRGMSSLSSSSFELGSSSNSLEDNDTVSVTEGHVEESIKIRRKSGLWNSIWGKHLP